MTQLLHRHLAEAETAEQQTDAVRALLDGCANPGVTRHALMVRLADLPPELRRTHHLRMIEGILDPLRNLDRAMAFQLPDGALLAVWRGDGGDTLDIALRALDQLFADLPCPVTLLDLPADSAVIARAIGGGTPQAAPPAPTGVRPLDLATLARLEAALLRTDVSPFARRTPICGWKPGQRIRLAWDRRYLSVGQLAATLAPGFAPRADPWLFRRLTRSLDQRLLTLLCDRWELRDAAPFALDLNVSSILGADFLRFDDALPTPLRTKVLLGLDPADILSDPAAFAFARDFARTRGYQLALRGVTETWLQVFPPDLLGVDYVRLHPTAAGLPRLAEGVAARAILCGVCDQAMLALGRAQGITLFEGPAVEPDPETMPKFNLRRK